MYKNDDRQNMGKIKFDIEIETIGQFVDGESEISKRFSNEISTNEIFKLRTMIYLFILVLNSYKF